MYEYMGKETMNIIVYHGGTETISRPSVDKGRRNLDFGQGFYLTDIREQAVDWGKHVSDRRKQPALLNRYCLNRESIILHYRCKVFTEYDGEWLDFIVDSRIGKEPWKSYDYIEGGVANDRVIDSINLYMADLMPREKVLEKLSEHRPNNQMCILNQEIIDKYLIYDRTEQL